MRRKSDAPCIECGKPTLNYSQKARARLHPWCGVVRAMRQVVELRAAKGTDAVEVYRQAGRLGATRRKAQGR